MKNWGSVGAAVGPRVQLPTLAVTVQLDAFTKVKAAIEAVMQEVEKLAALREKLAGKIDAAKQVSPIQK